MREAIREQCAAMVLKATGYTIEQLVAQRRRGETTAIVEVVGEAMRAHPGARVVPPTPHSDVELVHDGVTYLDNAGELAFYGTQNDDIAGYLELLEHGVDPGKAHRRTRNRGHREAAILMVAAGWWPDGVRRDELVDVESVLELATRAVTKRRLRAHKSLRQLHGC